MTVVMTVMQTTVTMLTLMRAEANLISLRKKKKVMVLVHRKHLVKNQHKNKWLQLNILQLLWKTLKLIITIAQIFMCILRFDYSGKHTMIALLELFSAQTRFQTPVKLTNDGDCASDPLVNH